MPVPRPFSRDPAAAGGRWPASARLRECRAAASAAILWLGLFAAVLPTGRADETPGAADAAAVGDDGGVGDDRGVFLPSDRGRERQLDRAKRLAEAQRWSDAVLLLDELLAADRDVFVPRGSTPRQEGATIASIKAEAARLVAALPKAGRDAYEAQFRRQAERSLTEAIARDDAEGIVAVARRWMNTAAGREAALLAAMQAIEAGQPLAAAAWLDRLSADEAAASLEPTLSVMQAWACRATGDVPAAAAALERARNADRRTVRVAGRDLPISFPAGQGGRWLDEVFGPVGDAVAPEGEWRQPRGTATRNGIAAASRPLLAARFRVPVARHPTEGRLLEGRRQAFADQDVPLFPAALPLAVDGTILVRTPLGVLAVDFMTGKRVWLQPGTVPADADEAEEQIRSRLPRSFDNLTDGSLSSDGRLVFAIDSHPDAFLTGGLGFDPFQGRPRATTWQGGNTLSAYDIRGRGRLRWRLPATAGLAAGAATSTTWFMGAPLVVADRLFVLVEERGEVRLDVLRSADGRVEWSQPLAELDEGQAIRPGESRWRQRAGLAPALGGGVLVCPLGTGSVVAVDLASRTLRWAHAYRRSHRDTPARPEGIRGRLPRGGIAGQTRGDAPSDADRWRDDGPIIAGDRVLLTPHDADELICLDLRDGAVRWTLPRDQRLLSVAGVVGDRVIVVGQRGVEAIDLGTGRGLWKCGFAADGGAPSGRGVLTADRLLLPLDVPEVIEIAVADGTITGRSPARGGAVPGNLVAYRGEMIAVGTDFLDVFHQVEALEPRVETATRDRPNDGWAARWGGQLAIDSGRIAAGLERLLTAERASPGSLPPDELAAALAVAGGRDFAAAAPFWQAVAAQAGTGPAIQAAAREMVDGFLRVENRAAAWEVCRDLVTMPREVPGELVIDQTDRRVRITDRAWSQGRLERLRRGAADELAAAIDAFLAAAVAAADATADPVTRLRRLDTLAAGCGSLPAGLAARERFALRGTRGGGPPLDPVRSDLCLLELARRGDGPQRQAAGAALAAATGSIGPEVGLAAWPLGRVRTSRPGVDRRGTAEDARARHLPVMVDAASESLLPGISLAYDQQLSRLAVLDGFGHPLGEPVAVDRADLGLFVPGAFAASIEAVAQGRVVYVRAAGMISAFAVGDAVGNRRLWTTGAPAGRTGQPLFPIRQRPPIGGIHRQGGIPLGMRITEPEDPVVAAGTAIWCGPRIAGVPFYEGRSLSVLDPASGAPLWRRHRLPPASELLADEEIVCVCTPDGRRSVVLAMADGRILRELDLPDRRHRLFAAGRLLLAIAPGAGDEDRQEENVAVEVWDTAAGTRRSLGTFAGAARIRAAGPGRVVVLEPSGALTLLDVARQAVGFVTRLGDMPDRVDELQVVPWQDRLLVLAGRRPDNAEGIEPASIIPLQQTLLSGHDGQMLSYWVWAVDTSTGAPLWSVPATVAHHAVHPLQPAGLPLLLFCRQIQGARARDTTQLSVLCLDKRTGHAVFEDDRIRVQPHLLYGCDMTGDPAAHTITLRSRGGDGQQVVLHFNGEPVSPRTPHQSSSRPPRPAESWDAWLEKALRRPAER